MVDRKDLDYQTAKEFNSFKKGSVDSTNNTAELVKQCKNDTQLIVTTLQKLNTAITKERHLSIMAQLKDKKIIFIFDECHRSQFGDTHKRIKEHFTNAQMFGFTGTPIFLENAKIMGKGSKFTTESLFDKPLHKYVITDAIKDENVLKFSIDYHKVFSFKANIEDEQVEDINQSEVFESDNYINEVINHIINNHSCKTHNSDYNAILCVQNIKTLIKYYDAFKKKKSEKSHNLKIATIFSYQANEDVDKIEDDNIIPQHSREKLDEYINDYNKNFGTNFSSDSFDNYYKDISKKVKDRKIDILIVVNMFLTGFDSKYLNTMYIDKKLQYHSLLQAYSRTNRPHGLKKSQGNILCYRNLKSATNEAIELFANKDAISEIILKPYENYTSKFKKAYDKLIAIAPTLDDVDNLKNEQDEENFIKAFRELLGITNILESFSQFNYNDLPISKQNMADYQSKYLDLYDKVKNHRQKETVSILDNIDFRLELIQNDIINVDYILNLLSKLKGKDTEQQKKTRESISNILKSEVNLRSKKELIEQFINKHFDTYLQKDVNVSDKFYKYMEKEKQKALNKLTEKENLDLAKLNKVINDYTFTQIPPLRDNIINMIIEKHKPSLKKRSSTIERIMEKINILIDTYFS